MIFGRFRRKKIESKEPEYLQEDKVEEIQNSLEEETKSEKENVDLTDRKQRILYIQRLYEGIQEARHQTDLIKDEYGEV
ncbi:MAG: hypothetical protein SO023_10700, partial [Eubacterium sp.]|nr:hypothetical protein [Eubacterium sp.]